MKSIWKDVESEREWVNKERQKNKNSFWYYEIQESESFTEAGADLKNQIQSTGV